MRALEACPILRPARVDVGLVDVLYPGEEEEDRAGKDDEAPSPGLEHPPTPRHVDDVVLVQRAAHGHRLEGAGMGVDIGRVAHAGSDIAVPRVGADDPPALVLIAPGQVAEE